MKKWKLLPKLAFTAVIKNGSVYFPYMAAGIFSVFTFFIFSSILCNDIISQLPHSAYAWALLMIGKLLLGCILLPFLFYTNSFLIKKRKKEIGLYHILGMEKKHIGSMMFFETALIYLGVLLGGILFGIVLARLFFLILLRMSGMTLDVEFVFYFEAFKETALFFFCVYVLNLIANLIQVGRSKPVELLSESRKGEKEPGFLWISTLGGLAALAGGYRLAVFSKIDSTIFTSFFLAILLVVVGTYLLFHSGSVAFLKILKKRKGIYYKPRNFITISGMYYRMKKSAASLSNLCIFSTMVMITLICTVSLYFSMDDISRFVIPYDVEAEYYATGNIPRGDLETEIQDLESKYGIQAERVDIYSALQLSGIRKENSFARETPGENNGKTYKIKIVLLTDYNQMYSQDKSLQEKEVLMFSSGPDFGYDSVNFYGEEFLIQEELTEFFPNSKSKKNMFNVQYVMIVKDEAVRACLAAAWAEGNEVDNTDAIQNGVLEHAGILFEGEDSEKAECTGELKEWFKSMQDIALIDGLVERSAFASMYGGLLFIGVLFSLIFFMCLILIMYYKQISEGYEDKDGFSIMQKVGMSDKEIRGTVHRQILMVFCMPLASALLHTLMGMFMVVKLMQTLNLFNTKLLFFASLAIAAVFIGIYTISYIMTAKTYYKIVRQA